MLLNIAALAVLILFGCHNPSMFNQSTWVLGYLLLYGYDVTGKSYQMRLVGMALGAAPVSYTHLFKELQRTQPATSIARLAPANADERSSQHQRLSS